MPESIHPEPMSEIEQLLREVLARCSAGFAVVQINEDSVFAEWKAYPASICQNLVLGLKLQKFIYKSFRSDAGRVPDEAIAQGDEGAGEIDLEWAQTSELLTALLDRVHRVVLALTRPAKTGDTTRESFLWKGGPVACLGLVTFGIGELLDENPELNVGSSGNLAVSAKVEEGGRLTYSCPGDEIASACLAKLLAVHAFNRVPDDPGGTDFTWVNT